MAGVNAVPAMSIVSLFPPASSPYVKPLISVVPSDFMFESLVSDPLYDTIGSCAAPSSQKIEAGR